MDIKQKAERKKVLDAMNKNDLDTAKIYAETVIRQKKEALRVRSFGVKMSALAQKLESAART